MKSLAILFSICFLEHSFSIAMAQSNNDLLKVAEQLEHAIGADGTIDIESQVYVPRICIQRNYDDVLEQVSNLPESIRAKVRGLTVKTDDEKGQSPNPAELKAASWAKIARLKNLVYLDVSHVRGLGESTKVLRELPRLVDLDVSHTGISGRQLVDIGECKELQSLSIGANKIVSGELAPLGKLTQLKLLALSRLDVTSADLKLISNLRKIETLILFRCPISDREMKILADFPRLATVDLNETNVTEAGIESLAESRPNLMIFWQDESR